ncbi:hypothetical protein MSPP1_001907 [Malassezia sp. CBS 17886]|nr:hypothetical protein MSPP1_001907 [Malassezia sp. CBS 17886]
MAATQAVRRALPQVCRGLTRTAAARASSTAAAPESGALKRVLVDAIRASGPLTVPAYMQACLLNPDYGYYAGRHSPEGKGILGATGDFITSPEISQVFGELLAVFFVSRWQAAGQPGRLRIVELGPGRGTLLSDMVRTFAAFPEMLAGLRSVELVEASPVLMAQQEAALRDTLARFGKTVVPADRAVEELGADEIRIEWFPTYNQVPVDPSSWTIVVAHEFFDALPIHIFEKKFEGWREVLVDVADNASPVTVLRASDLGKPTSASADPSLRFVLSSSATPWAQLLVANSERFRQVLPGQRVEVSPMSWALARRVGEWVSGYESPRIGRDGQPLSATPTEATGREQPSLGGCGLIIDYGGAQFFSDSFRAFREHRLVDPLVNPGLSDLTVNVDFAYLQQAIGSTDAVCHGPITQAEFLTGLGINVRVHKLIDGKEDERADAIKKAAARLVDQTSMGSQYKALCVTATGAPHAGAQAMEEVYPFL